MQNGRVSATPGSTLTTAGGNGTLTSITSVLKWHLSFLTSHWSKSHMITPDYTVVWSIQSYSEPRRWGKRNANKLPMRISSSVTQNHTGQGFLSIYRNRHLQGTFLCPRHFQPWIFIGRVDAEAETPVLWSPDAKSLFIGKDPGARKDWGQEEKGVTEDEMVGWHHWLNGHEFEQTLGDGEGQGSPVCWQSMGSQRVRHDWVTEKHQDIFEPH